MPVMLRQNINLYHQFSTPSGEISYLTWKRYWLLNAAFAACLFIIYFFSLFDNFSEQKQLTILQKDLASNELTFNQMKSKLPAQFFSGNIDDAVKNLKKELNARHKIIAILSDRIPFSEDLYALSRTITPKVWLTGIFIDDSGNEITLKGESIGIENLNNFMANLSNEKIFDNYGTELRDANNKDISNPNTRLNFEINMAKNHG
jgi:Tfp pilus assembly protein PilN